jgi:hypothetical protein
LIAAIFGLLYIVDFLLKREKIGPKASEQVQQIRAISEICKPHFWAAQYLRPALDEMIKKSADSPNLVRYLENCRSDALHIFKSNADEPAASSSAPLDARPGPETSSTTRPLEPATG